MLKCIWNEYLRNNMRQRNGGKVSKNKNISFPFKILHTYRQTFMIGLLEFWHFILRPTIPPKKYLFTAMFTARKLDENNLKVGVLSRKK